MPISVHRGDHVDFWRQRLGGHCVWLSPAAPLFVPEIQMGQPCLINIDDALASLQKGQHLLSVEHPGDQAPLGVALVGSSLK